MNSKANRIVKNEQELIDGIKLYLEKPKADSENRKELIQMQIGKPLEGTSQRIAATLRKWSQEK